MDHGLRPQAAQKCALFGRLPEFCRSTSRSIARPGGAGSISIRNKSHHHSGLNFLPLVELGSHTDFVRGSPDPNNDCTCRRVCREERKRHTDKHVAGGAWLDEWLSQEKIVVARRNIPVQQGCIDAGVEKAGHSRGV
ncbi:hypothetical protein [Aquamicrobium sp. LC103]|uniref:hypothetical protein n=1 Tax=Aquamicrobium sp. LC103 TaxID=1120658 RepID=UPI001484FBD7|nr:hypothetical protein [Aquamicrobium sp. LC103]